MTVEEIQLPVPFQLRLLWQQMGEPMDLGVFSEQLGLVVEGEDEVHPNIVLENVVWTISKP